MWAVRAGLQLRMRLCADEERVILAARSSRRCVRPETVRHKRHALIDQNTAEVVVDLIAMSVAFMDLFTAVELDRLSVDLIQNAQG